MPPASGTGRALHMTTELEEDSQPVPLGLNFLELSMPLEVEPPDRMPVPQLKADALPLSVFSGHFLPL